MSSAADKPQPPHYRSVRWPLLLAFVRTAAAALVVFVGLAWGGLFLWSSAEGTSLAAVLDLFSAGQWWGIGALLTLSALVAILLAGGAIGLGESRAIKWRLRTLVEATILWANGRLGHRIVVEGAERDEITELADSLNGMAEVLEEQVAALQRLVEKNEELYQQAAGLAALEERSRLARDLHDSVAQQLFALGMTAGAASKLIGTMPERAVPLVKQTEEMAAKAQAEMRALLLHLRPVELEGRSLVEAVERFLQDVCPRHQLQYELEIDVEAHIGEGIEGHLFRILQETVSNVVRHASAKRLQVRILQAGPQVVLSVQDDGKGFDPATVRDGSYGVKSIRERAEEIGGRLDVRSAVGAGTEVRVTVQRIG